MGYPCSPTWCNMYLAWFEMDYVKKLGKLGRFDLIKNFFHSFRYMDDLAFINNRWVVNCLNHDKPIDDNDVSTLYPLDFLQIKPTYNTSKTTYLNTEITLFDNSNGEYSSKMAWKKENFPCQTVEFNQVLGNRLLQQGAGLMRPVKDGEARDGRFETH